MEDLMLVATDISPSTSKPYVDLSTLQVAHWDQSILKHHITARPSAAASASSPTTSPPPQAKDLGISVAASDIVEAMQPNGAWHVASTSKLLFRIPEDSSSRIGDSIVEASSMDQLFDIDSPVANGKAGRVMTSEATFFGLAPDRLASRDIASNGASTRWSPHPPLRFGVEFWHVGSLTEKARLHSHTVWYAGSLYNVYVQVIRKKGVQLGVYLHRQSTVEAIPNASVPKSLPHLGPTRTHSRGPSLPTPLLHSSMSSPSIVRPRTPLRGFTPGSSPGAINPYEASSTTKVSSMPFTASVGVPAQPYRDSRPAVSAYFTIACHSARGNSLTRFTSAPDVFTVGQSWGWKSSSHTEEYFDLSDESPKPGDSGTPPEIVSLRATVVLGIV